jgi:hypothetical protein
MSAALHRRTASFYAQVPSSAAFSSLSKDHWGGFALLKDANTKSMNAVLL